MARFTGQQREMLLTQLAEQDFTQRRIPKSVRDLFRELVFDGSNTDRIALHEGPHTLEGMIEDALGQRDYAGDNNVPGAATHPDFTSFVVLVNELNGPDHVRLTLLNKVTDRLVPNTAQMPSLGFPTHGIQTTLNESETFMTGLSALLTIGADPSRDHEFTAIVLAVQTDPPGATRRQDLDETDYDRIAESLDGVFVRALAILHDSGRPIRSEQEARWKWLLSRLVEATVRHLAPVG